MKRFSIFFAKIIVTIFFACACAFFAARISDYTFGIFSAFVFGGIISANTLNILK